MHFEREKALIERGLAPVCGIDEVGRGPLAGPVVAAAVILNPSALPAGLRDSKALSPARRLALEAEIRETALAYALGRASVAEIDALNILQATFLAMRRAVAALSERPAAALVDGNQDPRLDISTELVVRGDSHCASIAAASIIAKCDRDRLMQDLAKSYPDYGWETNAGYGSRAHMEALNLVGPSPHHRRSFAPIAKLLLQE